MAELKTPPAQLQPVTTTMCASGVLALVVTTQVQGAKVRAQGLKVRIQCAKGRTEGAKYQHSTMKQSLQLA